MVREYLGMTTVYNNMSIEELKSIPLKREKLLRLSSSLNSIDYSSVKGINYDYDGSHISKHDKIENLTIKITERKSNLTSSICELLSELLILMDNATTIISFIPCRKQRELLIKRYIECKPIKAICAELDQSSHSSFYNLQIRALEGFINAQKVHSA